MTVDNRNSKQVFLRACVADEAEDWSKDAAIVRKLDDAEWRAVEALAAKHGLTGLVARGLSRAEVALGLRVPVLNQMDTVRRAHLIQHLARKATARRVAESLSTRGIAFVVFKGIALAEEVYGDLSLRSFGDFDLMVRPGEAEEAATVLQQLGYRLPGRVQVRDMVQGGCHAAIMSHPDGTMIDLHWLLSDELSRPADQELIWRECRAAPAHSDLPGLRFSHEMMLILLAAHYRHHAYELFKPLVDFMMLARKDNHDAPRLASLADSVRVLDLLRLCSELSRNLFSIHPAVESQAATRHRSYRVSTARKLLDEKDMPQTGPQSRLGVWLRCFLVNVCVGGGLWTARLMLLPSRGELIVLFKRPFTFSMYARYYGWRLFQILTGCRQHLTLMLQRSRGAR